MTTTRDEDIALESGENVLVALMEEVFGSV